MPLIEVKNFEVMPFIKMMTIVGTATGAIGGIVQGLQAFLDNGQPSVIGLGFLLGIVNGVVGGVVSGILLVYIYNFAAGKLGGVTFRAEAVEAKETKETKRR